MKTIISILSIAKPGENVNAVAPNPISRGNQRLFNNSPPWRVIQQAYWALLNTSRLIIGQYGKARQRNSVLKNAKNA